MAPVWSRTSLRADAVVEIDGIEHVIVAVVGDPGLVELGRQRPLLQRLAASPRVEQLDDRQLPRDRLLHRAR